MNDQAALPLVESRPPQARFTDALWGALIVLLVVAGLEIASHRLLHWFVLPVILCGLLVARDAVTWLRQGYDLFDPRGLIGAFGFHFFFLSPLLSAMWESELTFVASDLGDSRPWLGVTALLNAAGLALYHLAHACSGGWLGRERVTRRVFRPGAGGLTVAVLVLCVCAQGFVIYRYGGLSGLLLSEQGQQAGSAISGMGTFGMFGRAIPILLVLLATQLRPETRLRLATYPAVVGMVVLTFLLQLGVSGLGGSRSETGWAVLWVLGVIHYFWRRLTVKGLLPIVGFMTFFFFFYGFYKTLGVEAIARWSAGESVNEMQASTERNWRSFLLIDLSRVDIQAYLTYVMLAEPHDYRYRLGETYYGDLLAFVPRWLWPNPYNTGATAKAMAGTDAQRGEGSAGPDARIPASSRVYGLAGEAMLNFGVAGFIASFALLGALVGWIRTRLYQWAPGDPRLFLAPIFSVMLVLLLLSDSDNICFTVLMKVLLPAAVVWLGSKQLLKNRVPALPVQ